MTPQLLDRISAALDAGAAIPTAELTALLLDCGGEHCYQRPRLLHRLSAILHSIRPIMATSTTHRFKADFARKDFSGAPIVIGDKTKIVKADNLTDEDVPLLQQYGYGHLIEPIKGAAIATEGGVQTVNSGILQTAVEVSADSVTVKHSSGGPDDLPITAPAAAEAAATVPDKREQPELKPAPKAKTDPKDAKHK